MNAQLVTTPSGERLIMLPEAEYHALLDLAEDGSDRKAVESFRRRLAAGEEELVPAAVVDRIIAGESAITVWREHRGLTVAALAQEAGIGPDTLLEIEAGRQSDVLALERVASVLRITPDDLTART